MTKPISAAVEDYLRALHDLEFSSGGRVATSALADKMSVSSASVTGMLKKLSAETPRLVDYEPYQGARLTKAGTKIALEVIRHHRLIEAYLIEALGYSWDEVHAEADQLEHVISDALEARIAEYLGHPEIDPHGDPIPSSTGEVAESREITLSSLPVNHVGQISRVVDDRQLLQYLDRIGYRLGTNLVVTGRDPYQDLVRVRPVDGGQEVTLGRKLTEQIFVVERESVVEDEGE